jgi:putative pyruvate formate lyase activating enzyme
MLRLQENGCANIEPVSPSHHLPGLLEALGIAVAEGLHLPVVYNTNAYEAPETLDLLNGIVDVYLPDLKYASNSCSSRYSDVDNYVEVARTAILKMHAQVGNLVVNIEGAAVRGLVLRHLVLPGDLSGTKETLLWISENLPRTVTVSLMAQYIPLHRSGEFPELNRSVTTDEYERAVDYAWDLGLENVFVQDLASQEVGLPDFRAGQPFDWDA